jgi:hypothetical protein
MQELTIELIGPTETQDKGIIKVESDKIKEKEYHKVNQHPLLSPKIRKQEMKDALRKTRNASIENFMKFQWSWSI